MALHAVLLENPRTSRYFPGFNRGCAGNQLTVQKDCLRKVRVKIFFFSIISYKVPSSRSGGDEKIIRMPHQFRILTVQFAHFSRLLTYCLFRIALMILLLAFHPDWASLNFVIISYCTRMFYLFYIFSMGLKVSLMIAFDCGSKARKAVPGLHKQSYYHCY